MKSVIIAVLCVGFPVVSLVHEREAGAVTCQGFGRRLLAVQGPEIEFIAGTPSTKSMKPVTAFFEDQPFGDSDCQLYARTFVPGVKVQQSYGGVCSQQPFVNGAWVEIGQALGHVSGNRSVWPINNCDAPPNTGIAQVSYDGTGSTQQGFIEIGVNHAGEFANPQVIGYVNVRISASANQTSFIVTSNASNVSGDALTISHPLLDGSPNAILFAQHHSSTTSQTWNHPTALFYDYGTARWKIRNQDAATMSTGLEFYVRVDPSAKKIVTAFSSQSYALTIDDPTSNFNPFANIIVSPFTAGNRTMQSPFHVQYNEIDGYWRIVASDLVNLPTSYCSTTCWRFDAVWYRPGFFVKVLGAAHFADDTLFNDPSGILNSNLVNGSGVDVLASTTLRNNANIRYLRYWCWTTSVITPVLTTFNATPLPGRTSAPPVTFQGTGWNTTLGPASSTVFHENGATMISTLSFNVWASHRADCP